MLDGTTPTRNRRMPHMTAHPAVILGVGAAGTAAARALVGHAGIQTTIIGRTGETPYSRMLIKGVAYGSVEPGLTRLPLPDADFIADTVEIVDTETREVQLTSGLTVAYDSLIVATGSRPRRLDTDLPGAEQAARAGSLFTLHSLDDAVRIREAVLACGRPARIAIYGAGLIASETASALQEQGHRISLIARSELPGVAAFGRSVAARIAADHRLRVATHFGRTIERIRLDMDATFVTLDDGTDIDADLVIFALGTTPVAPAPWGIGVDVDDRLRAHGIRAHGVPNVLAAGGTAVHHDDHLGTWRIDHWDDGAAQGAHAAQALLHSLGRGDDPGPYRPRSAHMALIHGRVVAGVGFTDRPEDALIEGVEEFVVVHEHGDTVVGASGIDAVGAVYQWGQRLHEGSS
jgi:3-phenylpropionate/trans-cinnamate dioxygenase ferredoxin reductase subunit